MTVIRNRIPSRQEILHLYAFTTVLLHAWSFVNVFRAVSAWVYSMTIWDILGSVSYTQLFVLVESVGVVFGMVVLASILPASFFRKRFTSQGGAMVLVIVVRVIFAHIRGDEVNIWINNRKLIRWFADLLVIMAIMSIGVSWLEWSQNFMKSFVERFLILGWLFFFGDMLSVLVILWRNMV